MLATTETYHNVTHQLASAGCLAYVMLPPATHHAQRHGMSSCMDSWRKGVHTSVHNAGGLLQSWDVQYTAGIPLFKADLDAL